MEKLVLFALAFMAIAVSVGSAYKTTIVTRSISNRGLIMDGISNSFPTKYNGLCICDGISNTNYNGHGARTARIPIQQLNHCKMHLTQGIIFDKMVGRPFQQQQAQHLEQCCRQLKQVNEQCQCDAIQQLFNEAVQPQGGVAVAQMFRKAKKLSNECKLEVQKCSLVSPTDA
ncbi:2S seed storage albumin protein-like [Bidens hawaiensis]|uniref:2S seed storage albumin protein-like n=1 Tax=Bidens hawaiensis TaxID=980011 RepID=UPI00404A2A04